MLPYINVPFAHVAGLIGASTDELKLMFSFLLSYPLSAVLKRIPDNKPWQKNLFVISVSLFYLIGLFDLWLGLRTLLISSMGIYAIALFIDGPYMPWIGFTFVMVHMSINHISRQMTNSPSSVDITGAQMVMIMKLSAFCWNVWDGKQPESSLSESQKERAIKEVPALLDYLGFVFFFPSLMAGPAFDYTEYRNYVTTSMFVLPPGTDPALAPKTRKKRRIPRSGTPAAFKAAQGILWIIAFLRFSAWYYPDAFLEPSYVEYGIIRRIFIMYMVNITARMKYYGVWTLTEGACILSGFGYRGIDPVTKRPAWDRLQNIKPLGVELAQNSHAYLGNWNINTNLWLRNYVYLRVTPKGQKPGFQASMATFVTSAFWHGFYPGYYMSFVLASFIQTVAKNGRRFFRPFFVTADGKPTALKPYYDVFTWLVTQIAFSFTTTPFLTLTFSSSFTAWARVYFYAVVGVALCFGFFASPAKPFLVKELKRRSPESATAEKDGKGEGPGVARVDSRGEMRTTLGVPNDPQMEVDDIVREVKKEIEARKRKGIKVDARAAKQLVEEKIEEQKIM